MVWNRRICRIDSQSCFRHGRRHFGYFFLISVTTFHVVAHHARSWHQRSRGGSPLKNRDWSQATGEVTPSLLGDMDVPPFWPPFLPFWGLDSIFLGYFFSSINTETIFWDIRTTNSYKIRSFWPQTPVFPRFDLFGYNPPPPSWVNALLLPARLRHDVTPACNLAV